MKRKPFLLTIALLVASVVSTSCMATGESQSSSKKESQTSAAESVLESETVKESASVSESSSEMKEIVITDEQIAQGYTRYDVTTSLARKTEGFGTQFDTLIVEKENRLTEEEWQLQIDALKEMNLQNVRIRFYPEMYERANDNDDPNTFDYFSKDVDFNSAEMNYLYRLLDVFEEEGVKVDLSWYGCRTTFDSVDGKYDGSWLGGKYGQDGINSWMVAPRLTENPEEEYAESIAACLKYLYENKGYTCINEISVFPEPEGVVGAGNVSQLFNIINSVKTRLIAMGLKDRVTISGPADYNNNSEVYAQKYLSSGVFEKGTSSVYPFGVDTENAVMLDFAQGYAKVCNEYGISWGVAECGTYNFLTPVTNKDSETYDRALFMAKFFTNMVNGGCTNIKYFVFSDCYYDGALNQLGLFKFRHDGFKAKPVWYSWSLLCKYTDIGSEVFPITVDYAPKSADDNMAITALKLPDGSWTYVAVNDSEKAKKIAIVNGRVDRPSQMNVFRLTGASIPEDGALKVIDPTTTVNGVAGVVYLTVPANGFLVVSDKPV